jgi:hypothetical protein
MIDGPLFRGGSPWQDARAPPPNQAFAVGFRRILSIRLEIRLGNRPQIASIEMAGIRGRGDDSGRQAIADAFHARYAVIGPLLFDPCEVLPKLVTGEA